MPANRPKPAYFANPRPEVAVLLPARSTHVLEVGCGAGRFAAQVPQRQSYWGIEPAAGAADEARAVLDEVIHGTFEDAASRLPDRHFDLVICNDVIEHIANPEAFLQAVQAKMAPGAVMVGSVPNVRYLPNLLQLVLHKDWAYADEGVLDRTHLRFFTARSLERTVVEQGFEVEALVGLNSIIAHSPWPGRLRWAATLALLELATLRGQGDTRFLQFGFRIRPRRN